MLYDLSEGFYSTIGDPKSRSNFTGVILLIKTQLGERNHMVAWTGKAEYKKKN